METNYATLSTKFFPPSFCLPIQKKEKEKGQCFSLKSTPHIDKNVKVEVGKHINPIEHFIFDNAITAVYRRMAVNKKN